MFKIFFIFMFVFLSSLYSSYLIDANKALSKDKIDDAIHLYKLSAREGNVEANFQLGKIYYLKIYRKRNLKRAYEYFKKASDYEHSKARYNLAVLLSQKNFHYYNLQESYELFYSLAIQDYPSAQYKVGIYLLYGLGVEKDYSMAKEWLERSYFVNNYTESSCGLAIIYANGFGVLQNLGRARNLSFKNIGKYPLCEKVFYEFKLYKSKYKFDKGFKYGYYK